MTFWDVLKHSHNTLTFLKKIAKYNTLTLLKKIAKCKHYEWETISTIIFVQIFCIMSVPSNINKVLIIAFISLKKRNPIFGMTLTTCVTDFIS